MTEEIIIDCIHKHYDSEICNAYSNNVFSWDCSEFNNCYYKQLKRLEQENKELKEKIKKYSAINEQDTKDYAILRNALEEIRAILNKECGIISNAKVVGLINEVLNESC